MLMSRIWNQSSPSPQFDSSGGSANKQLKSSLILKLPTPFNTSVAVRLSVSMIYIFPDELLNAKKEPSTLDHTVPKAPESSLIEPAKV